MSDQRIRAMIQKLVQEREIESIGQAYSVVYSARPHWSYQSSFSDSDLAVYEDFIQKKKEAQERMRKEMDEEAIKLTGSPILPEIFRIESRDHSVLDRILKVFRQENCPLTISDIVRLLPDLELSNQRTNTLVRLLFDEKLLTETIINGRRHFKAI